MTNNLILKRESN